MLVSMEPLDAEAFRRAVARGEAAALQRLYDACGGPVLALLDRFFRGEADDLRHEVFLRARDAVASGRFRGESRLETWVWRLAAHHCIDERRRRARRDRRALDASALEGIASDEPSLDRALAVAEDARRLLAEGWPALREEERKVLFLRFARGLKFREIAEALEVPLGTASTWLRSGLARLRGVLESPAPRGTPPARRPGGENVQGEEPNRP